jgi:hypothetical protein
VNRRQILDRLIGAITSLRLTVACLMVAIVLVFWGTLAQVDLGLYKVQNEFFRGFFIWWTPPHWGLRLPVFPGGYLVGGVLVINLISSHFRRFTLTADKAGIWLVHFGLILLLFGQFLTDRLSRESMLHLRESESRNYSESEREGELAIIDRTDPTADSVVAIPQRALMRRKEIRQPALPFAVKVRAFYANSKVAERAPNAAEPPAATEGAGQRATVEGEPRVTDTETRDVPSAVVELVTAQGSLGTWLVSEYVNEPQEVTVNKRTYQLAMRRRRFYKPFSLQLVEFRHDVYPGTDIPKNFSSRVLLQRPDTGEKREVLIYMNNPLRYGGETFYQAGWDKDDHGSTLQVVHNPSWLTPYFSCILVGIGLVWQFLTHLLGFTLQRKPVPAGSAPAPTSASAGLALKQTKV